MRPESDHTTFSGTGELSVSTSDRASDHLTSFDKLAMGLVAFLLILLLLPIDYTTPFARLIVFWTGIVGTLLVAVALYYTIGKRRRKGRGAKFWLSVHQYWNLIGGAMLVYHSRLIFEGVVSSLATIFLLLTIVSGYLGRWLLLHPQRRWHLGDRVLTSAQVFRVWRVLHLPAALTLIVLLVWHVVSVFYFRGFSL